MNHESDTTRPNSNIPHRITLSIGTTAAAMAFFLYPAEHAFAETADGNSISVNQESELRASSLVLASDSSTLPIHTSRHPVPPPAVSLEGGPKAGTRPPESRPVDVSIEPPADHPFPRTHRSAVPPPPVTLPAVIETHPTPQSDPKPKSGGAPAAPTPTLPLPDTPRQPQAPPVVTLPGTPEAGTGSGGHSGGDKHPTPTSPSAPPATPAPRSPASPTPGSETTGDTNGQNGPQPDPNTDPPTSPPPRPRPAPVPAPAPKPPAAPETPADPNARFKPLLDLIAGPESGGNYNAYFGNGKNTSIQFTKMSVGAVLQWQANYVANGSASSAVGRYQFLQKTLRGLVTNLNIDPNTPFDERLQDQFAVVLLKNRGLDDYMAGRISWQAFATNIAHEWASLPCIDGPHPSASCYANDGLNRSFISIDTIHNALVAIKS